MVFASIEEKHGNDKQIKTTTHNYKAPWWIVSKIYHEIFSQTREVATVKERG